MADALRVRTIRIERLRNVERVDLDLAEGQNLLVGGNGQGKTTMLEALYVLGAMRSFRGARSSDLVRHGDDDAVLLGELGSRAPLFEVSVRLSRGSREVRVDGKRAEFATHFRRFPMVAFQPGDLEIVFGGPAVRRRFLDRMLFQAEVGYAQWFREYRRALQSRNELIKRDDSDRQVRAYDRVLAPLGASMGLGRRRMTERLAEATGDILARLGVPPFEVRLKTMVEPEEDRLLEALERSLAIDRRRGRTTVGPHTDDVELSRDAGPARAVASRGEARALTVALRLAERRVISETADSTPLLLLDDVWAELDRERAEKVLDMVAETPGQVVVTGTGGSEPGNLEGWRRFEVENGRIRSNEAVG